jgi:enterochelin esterase-like enzyme
MDGLLCAGAIRPAVIVAVGVHASSRADQYLPVRTRYGHSWIGGQGDVYLDLLEHEVLPAVRTHLHDVPLSDASADRVLLGSSIGGVSALYGAMARPSVFGGAIALSPSAWVDDGLLTRIVQREGVGHVRIAADIGHAEQPTILGHCRHLFDELSSRGNGRVLADVVDGVHHEDSWRSRLPRLLQHVLAPC